MIICGKWLSGSARHSRYLWSATSETSRFRIAEPVQQAVKLLPFERQHVHTVTVRTVAILWESRDQRDLAEVVAIRSSTATRIVLPVCSSERHTSTFPADDDIELVSRIVLHDDVASRLVCLTLRTRAQARPGFRHPVSPESAKSGAGPRPHPHAYHPKRTESPPACATARLTAP